MNLGPCFLENDDPEFVTVGTSEAWRLVEARDEVIHDDLLMEAILIHLHAPDALLVHLVRLEQPVYTVGELGEHGQSRQEVAIAENSLPNIVGSNTIGKDGQLALIVVQLGDLSGSDPLHAAVGSLARVDSGLEK